MKTARFLLFAIIAMALPSEQASAQRGYGGPSFSLDMASGCPFQAYSLTGENYSVRGLSSGDYNSYIRISYFIDGKWGLFLQSGELSSYVSERNLLGAVNAAEGGRYRYSGSSLDWNSTCSFLGASYNCEYRRFGFVPRVGIGFMSPYYSCFNYVRVARDGQTGREYFSFSNPMSSWGDDYLLDDSYGYEIPSLFSAMASFQVSYNLFRWMYVFVEPSLMVPFKKADLQCEYYGSKLAYTVTTWAESMSYGDVSDIWVPDPASQVNTTVKAGGGPVFSLNFGIGFNFRPFRSRHE